MEKIVSIQRKWILRLFTRSLGLIESLTYESPEDLVNKFFSDREGLVHCVVRDTTDEPVDQWFNNTGKGEIVMLTVTQFLGPQRVQPVQGNLRPIN